MEIFDNSKLKVTETSHIAELDGVRGVAILSVLFYHLFWFTSPGGSWTGIPFAVWKVAQIGWIGVNIFFVLSGFLITRILISKRDQKNYFKSFYLRRALRILPLFFLTLAFIYFHYENSRKFVLLNLIFMAHIPAVFNVVPCYPGLWSLSMEEQFYLVWPQFVRRVSPLKLWIFAVLLCLLSPVLRASTFVIPSYSLVAVALGGFDGFGYGAIIALLLSSSLNTQQTLKRHEWACLLLGLGMLILGAKFGITTRQKILGEMFLPTIIYLLTSTLITHCIRKSGSKYLRVLRKGFLPHWGLLSYGAYLCHYPVPEIVEKIFSWYPHIYSYYFSFGFACLQFGLALLGTYIIALMLHRWIEVPFLKLKTKQFIVSQKDSHETAEVATYS